MSDSKFPDVVGNTVISSHLIPNVVEGSQNLVLMLISVYVLIAYIGTV